jgi:hypothetical protein
VGKAMPDRRPTSGTAGAVRHSVRLTLRSTECPARGTHGPHRSFMENPTSEPGWPTHQAYTIIEEMPLSSLVRASRAMTPIGSVRSENALIN